jgi:hypothetical protein
VQSDESKTNNGKRENTMAKKSSEKLTLAHVLGYGTGNEGYAAVAVVFVILFAAPILTKKWDLVVIIRTCLLVGAVGFAGLLTALGSFCCFTFIWCINSDVRAKMAEWKAAKAK